MLLDVKEYVLDVKKCILHDFLTLISTQENLIFHSLHTISLKWDSQKSYYDEIRLYAKLNYAVRYEKLDFRCNWLVFRCEKVYITWFFDLNFYTRKPYRLLSTHYFTKVRLSNVLSWWNTSIYKVNLCF